MCVCVRVVRVKERERRGGVWKFGEGFEGEVEIESDVDPTLWMLDS
jgi:hypothetical protein